MPEATATVDSIVAFFEKEFANIRCQSTWDFSGRQIYLGNRDVRKVCLALDPTESSIRQAIDRGCEVLVTHHPLFFASIKGINSSKTLDRSVVAAIKNNLNIFSYHTTLDMAQGGLNDHLLKLLSVDSVEMFDIEGTIPYLKLEVFVPVSHETAVLDAIDKAGGGAVGNYRRCAFSSEGTGTFIPLLGSNPYVGTQNKAEYVKETCLSLILPTSIKDKVIAAVVAAHPYETPAFNFTDINSPIQYGFGRIGTFSKPRPFSDFLSTLKDKLNLKRLSINMPHYDINIDRFAVVTGSGASMWKKCLRHGIKLLVTGDMKHHDALDARENGVCIVDAGHFHTERVYMNYLAGVLAKRFDIETFCAVEHPAITMI